MWKKKLPQPMSNGRIKRVADESKPVVVVPVIVEPVEVGLALRVVPPDIADLLLAFEGKRAEHRLRHCPLKRMSDLWTVSYSGSKIP